MTRFMWWFLIYTTVMVFQRATYVWLCGGFQNYVAILPEGRESLSFGMLVEFLIFFVCWFAIVRLEK